MSNDKKFQIEVTVVEQMTLKTELKRLFSLGIFELWDFYKLFDKHFIEVSNEETVHHVTFRNGKEIERVLLPLTFEQLKRVLNKDKYVYKKSKYIFKKETIIFF